MSSLTRLVPLFLALPLLAATNMKYLQQAFEWGLAAQSLAGRYVGHEYTGFCLGSGDAEVLAHSFGQTISNYTTELAVQLFTNDFTDQSDSVNSLIQNSPLPNIPLGEFTFANKQEFLDGQGDQPPVPFDILNTWHTCDTVIVRWLSKQEPDQVQGVTILTATPAREGEGGGFGAGIQKYQVTKAVAEFNSAAWLVNLGKPECGSKH